MAKVGAAASIKKKETPAQQAQPQVQQVAQATPVGMAMTPQTVTPAVGQVQYNVETDPVSYNSGQNLRRFALDMMNSRKYDTGGLSNDAYIAKENARINRARRDSLNNPRHFDPDFFYYHLTDSGWNELTKNRAEEDASMGGARYQKSQINDFLRQNPGYNASAIEWPRTSYGGKAVTGSFPYAGVGSYAARGFPTYEEDWLWSLANGMKY